VIIVICLLVGLALRAATGRGLRSLSEARLRGEVFLMGLLVAQAVVPMLDLTGTGARIAYYVWLCTFPGMAVVAWLNRRSPGMVVLGVGLALNFVVIAANDGMPVFGEAVAMVKAGTCWELRRRDCHGWRMWSHFRDQNGCARSSVPVTCCCSQVS
jgi:hypothetical protein